MSSNPYSKLRPKTRKPYTTIYLIRHCNPDYTKEARVGSENMPLSKYGREQRALLTKKLKHLKIDKVYSSNLLRAKETAELFAKKSKKQVNIDPRFDEIDWKDWHRVKYFHMSEKSRAQQLKNYRQLDRQLDKMQETARRALAEIFKLNRGKTIAVFSHGNFIKAIITSILNADVLGFLSLEIFQSSISKVVIDRDGFVKINFINSAEHLQNPPDEDLFITLVD